MPDQIPLLSDEPHSPTTRDLLAWFIDASKGAVIPKRVKGQLARAIKDLLDEGISADNVQAGLGRLLDRKLVQPELLPHLVMEASMPVPVKEGFHATVESTVPADNSHLEKYFDGAIDDEERKRVAAEMREAAKGFGGAA